MSSLYRIIVLLLALGAGTCASSQTITSADDDEDQDIGLGGTGLLASPGSGLGGTGIVGVITGFGSIFVNGIEIEYDSETPFSIDGETTAHQELAVGDVVEVLTTDANKHTDAQVINLRHEVIGKVESVNAQNASFIVLGQTVIQPDSNNVLPEAGTMVAVSGFRINEQTIQATRIKLTERKQTLLRSHTELPFMTQATRWLIQTHARNGKAAFWLDGAKHVVSLHEKAVEPQQGDSGIRILKLQKSIPDQLKLEQVIEPVDMPHGQLRAKPLQHPDNNMMQKPMPAHMNNQQRNRQ